MEESLIQISIQLESGEVVGLNLSPNSYQESFREFKKKHNINERQAFRLKNLIQAKLIEIASSDSWGYFTPPRKEEERQQTTIESPRFQRPYTDEESQTDLFLDESRVAKIQDRLPQQSDRQILDGFPLTPKISHPEKEESRQYFENPFEDDQQELPNFNVPERRQDQNQYKPQPYIPPEKQDIIPLVESRKKKHPKREDKKKKQIVNNRDMNISDDLLKKGKKHCKPKKESDRIKFPAEDIKKTQSPLKKGRNTQINLQYDRLYYQPTDSFRSKNNQEIDRRQLNDYLQVQKYELSNRLRRTSPQFFYHLHKHTTQSWEQKISPSKIQEEEDSLIYQIDQHPKKVSIEKAFKGSLWKSRMRCQAKEYENQIDAELSAKKEKQASIRKRMIEERKAKGKNEDLDKSIAYLSRVCEKCSPKKIEPVKKRKKKEFPKGKDEEKRRYISNILSETYKQTLEQVNNLQIS